MAQMFTLLEPDRVTLDIKSSAMADWSAAVVDSWQSML